MTSLTKKKKANNRGLDFLNLSSLKIKNKKIKNTTANKR